MFTLNVKWWAKSQSDLQLFWETNTLAAKREHLSPAHSRNTLQNVVAIINEVYLSKLFSARKCFDNFSSCSVEELSCFIHLVELYFPITVLPLDRVLMCTCETNYFCYELYMYKATQNSCWISLSLNLLCVSSM